MLLIKVWKEIENINDRTSVDKFNSQIKKPAFAENYLKQKMGIFELGKKIQTGENYIKTPLIIYYRTQIQKKFFPSTQLFWIR